MAKIRFKKWFEASSENFIARIIEHRQIKPDGSVAFNGFTYEDDVSILLSAIDLPSPSVSLLRSAISRSLSSPKLPQSFDANALLAAIKTDYYKSLNDQTKSYVVVCGLYYLGPSPFAHLTRRGVRIQLKINPHSKANARFFKEHDDQVKSDFKVDRHLLGSGSPRPVKLFVRAGNPEDAYRKARDAFDDVRGVMNFINNRSKHSRRSMSSERRAVNDVQTSRYATIHDQTGKLAYGGVWYFRDWSKPSKPVDYSKETVRLKWLHQCLRCLQNEHPLSDRATYALRMYCRALDTNNWQESFLSLWSTLEHLMLIGRNDSHEVLVDRLSRLYRDEWLARLYLNHLRDVRNSIVHSSQEYSEPQIETFLFQLNRDVCHVLDIYVCNSLKLESEAALRDFLDVGLDNAAINAKIALLKRVIHFRRAEDS